MLASMEEGISAENEECTAEAMGEWELQDALLKTLLQSLEAARQGVLLLDFDGTLASFRVDPARVRPWAGIPSLLERIQATGHTRIAIITGRPAGDVARQLGMTTPPEIWGLHGAERRFQDGSMAIEPLPIVQQQTLAEARESIHEEIRRLGVHLRTEDKPNAVVVHWRGKSLRTAQLASQHILKLIEPLAASPGMKLLQFDGGVELRAGRDKGDAVSLLLGEVQLGTPAAYLGDDTTDEDAFLALGGRGLGVLVRREWRPSAAPVWLRPPAQLREFLEAWLRAIQQ